MEYSRFFNSVSGDRVYGQEDFSDFLKSLVFTGLLKDQLNELEATADGVSLDITVDTGRAFVEGFQYLNDAIKTLTLDSESFGNDRIDRIIVKMDKSSGVRSVITTILKGSPSGTPIAPTLTKSGDIYELSLAQVLVTGGQSYIDLVDVTDERGDATLCPYASSGAVAIPASDSVTNDMLVSDIKIGSLASLATTIKTSIVNAINELVSAISSINSSISNIISGATTVGNADKLDTHDSTYFATASGLSDHEDNIAGGTIGHVKSGGDVTIDGAGVVSVNDDSHDHVISNVDGLQAVLDGKLSTTGKAADSEKLDGNDSTFYGKSLKSGTGTIPTTGWVAESGDYNYKLSLAISGIIATDFVFILLDKDVQDLAQEAELSPSNDSYAGGTILYANNIPTSTMAFSYLGLVP